MINILKRIFDKKTTLPPVKLELVLSSLSEIEDWGLVEHNIPKVWQKIKGKGVTVAVIDTGMPRHEDIGENAVLGLNCIPGQDPYDNHGHQTHCVGIICAKDNDRGMVGVAPLAKSLCIKGLSDSGSGTYMALNQALQFCIDSKPDLVSMSLGGRAPSKDMHDKIKTLTRMNIPVICAAGNDGAAGVNYPAAFPETIAVGAYDKYGRIAGFSSKGDQVDFAAPGVQIYSTYLNGRYARMSGTSMACPFMAGVVALMIAKWKKDNKHNYTVDEIKTMLMQFSDDKGVIGKDKDWGYGVVDVDRMLIGSDPEPEPEPEPEPTPEPEPEPEPTPEPEPKKPWLTKKLTWIVFGVMLTVIMTVFGLSFCTSDDFEIPNPPYIDEHGNVDWDKKFEMDK